MANNLNQEGIQNPPRRNSDVYSIKQHEALITDKYDGHIITIPDKIVVVKRGVFSGTYKRLTGINRRSPLKFISDVFNQVPRPPRVVVDRKGFIWVVFSRIIENNEFFGIKKDEKLIYIINKMPFTNDLDEFTNIPTVDKNNQTVNVDFSYSWRVVDPIKYIRSNRPEGEVLSYIQALINAFIKRTTYKELTGGDLNHDSISLNVKDDNISVRDVTRDGRTVIRQKPNFIKRILDETKNKFGIEIVSLTFQHILPDKKIVEEINKTETVKLQMEQRRLITERDIADIQAYRDEGFTNDQIAKMRAINSDKAKVGVVIADGPGANLSAQIGAGIVATREDQTVNSDEQHDQQRQYRR